MVFRGKGRQITRFGGTAVKWAGQRLLMAVIVCVGSGILGSCASSPTGPEATPTSVPTASPEATPTSAPIPVLWPGKEWPTSTPEEQGMDSGRLQQMMEYIDGEDVPMHSVLVIRHGHMVWEEYRNGYHAERSQDIQSVTKSFTSTLIGIAIRLGLIEDVQQRMVDLFPDHAMANRDARKERITLEHLLTMSEGMDWHEHDYPYTDERNTLGQMWVSKDAVQHVLDRPMAREPGESWAYNSGTSILLGGIIEQVTGGDVPSFAEEHLFKPIGIEGYWWARTTGGHHLTDGGLHILPRDMARLGYLMLHQGTWDGQEIVSANWVAEASREHFQTPWGDGYGYQWWIAPSSQVYRATGHYGQMICVVPEADMVVVFTGDIPDSDPYPHDALVFHYILEACKDLPYEALHKSYAKYGWACEYPAGYRIREAPIGDAPEVSDASGSVQFQFVGYPLDLFVVVWRQAEQDQDLGSYLDEVFADANQEPEIVWERGPFEEGHKGAHRMIQQTFEVLVQGRVAASGLAAAWYCPEASRGYVVVYESEPGMPGRDPESAFQQFLESLACHS
jgi:CubicO group peptidase (beta-lactamase class C family)